LGAYEGGTAIPIITGTTPGSHCGTGTVSLGATSSAGTINWYDVSSGGSSLGNRNFFYHAICFHYHNFLC